jgi:hypothetical protein
MACQQALGRFIVETIITLMGYALGLRSFGTSRLLMGFVAGAVFTLAPMYYFFTAREAALRGASGFATDAPVAEAPSGIAEQGRNLRGASVAFASRLTYELRQLPEEPPAAAVRTAPPPVAAAPALPGESETARVTNARPISSVAPQARDRTPAIERESHKAEYREAPRQQPAPQAQAPAQPPARVVEGRDVVMKTPRLPDTPTRPIVADSSVNMRAEIESERSRLSAEVARAWPMPTSAEAAAARKSAEARPVIALAPPIVGATPISRAAEPPRKEAEVKPAAAGASGANGEGDVENRLVATREWLAAAPQNTHTIQLLGTNSEAQLKAQLKSLSKQLEPGKIFVYRTLAQGKPSMTIVYGAYADKAAAVQALEKLPSAITANRPVLRTVNGIRAEMKQHRTDS